MLAVQRITASPKRAVYLPSTSVNSVVRCLAQPTGVEVPLVMRRHTTKPHASRKGVKVGTRLSPAVAISPRGCCGGGPSWRQSNHGVPAPQAHSNEGVGKPCEVSAKGAGDHSICSSFPFVGLQVAYCLTGSLLCCLPSYHQAPSSGTPLAVPSPCGRPCLGVVRPFTVRLGGIHIFKIVVPVPVGGANKPCTHWSCIGRKLKELSTMTTTKTECGLRTRLLPTHVGVRRESGGNAVTTGRAKARQVVSPRGGLANTNRVPQTRPAKACLREALLLGRGAKPHMLSLWLDTPSAQHERRFATVVLKDLRGRKTPLPNPYQL